MAYTIDSSFVSTKNHDAVLGNSVIRTLLYFDIFHFPLSLSELFTLNQHLLTNESDLAIVLENLIKANYINYHEGFYFLKSSNQYIDRNNVAVIKTDQVIKRLQKYSGLIASFPFVKGVTISGSLSKNFMDENSDIDYFIITAKNRLWLARTLLILYKKIFLFNSKKNFCVNYFVSEDQLTIPDRNIFTATEVCHLIPLFNYEAYLLLMKMNNWNKEFYPNFPLRKDTYVIKESYSRIKNGLEKLFSGEFGEKLDNYFFKLTLRRWKKKFKHFDESTFDLRMRSKKNVSKHHPNGFQEKILSQLSEKIIEFEKHYHISLSNE